MNCFRSKIHSTIYFFFTPINVHEEETVADDDYINPDESNTQDNGEAKETEDDEDDEDEVDETTNVRKKHNKRNLVSDHQSRQKAIARRKKRYNLQFTFDADVRCAITIYYFCTEEITPQVKFLSFY